MVFIHETHVMPSSGKVETKSHLFSYVVPVYNESCQCVSCSKQEQINTLRTLGWSWLHPFCGIILFIHDTINTHCEKLFLLLATNTLCSTHDLQEAITKKDVFSF